MEFYAVLLDTMSIQRYIFSTNRLKENLGASYLVRNIYETQLREVLLELFPDINKDIFTLWKREPERMPTVENNAPFEIGYIGGGNAFLLFKEKGMAEEFIKKWTLRLILDAPGIVPASAIEKIQIGDALDERCGEALVRLFRSLAENKNKYIPQTIIPRHGITAECSHTGYSMEVWCEKLPEEEQKYLSSVSSAKIHSAERAKREVEELLKYMGLNERYTFPDELDRLGQTKGEENHIAIVHIDGNDTGQRFKDLKTLVEKRKLSISLASATEETFKDLIRKIDEDLKDIQNEFSLAKENDGLFYLPIRPIIIGGDDITFVADGRLGIYLAKLFLESFERKAVSDGKPISACAGIAITKTKYPFYRGYELSEELLNSAKARRKEKGGNGSWLDFHILKGSISGRLEELRDKDYMSSERRLYMRPYNLADFNELITSTHQLKSKFPRSKIMKLREVLYMDSATQSAFITELKARDLKLPPYKEWQNELIINNETPYLDMIECLEFYPEFAIKGV